MSGAGLRYCQRHFYGHRGDPGLRRSADATVTFNLPKTGQLLPPGTEYTGALTVHDIGIPEEAKEQVHFDGEYVTGDMVKSWLPKPMLESHKGDFGKLLLLCGSEGFTGAAALSAKAALRTGAGLVYLGVPEPVYPILAAKLDAAVVFPLPGNGNAVLAALLWERSRSGFGIRMPAL